MKIAIAIIVKDESTDILPWLCWHFNLKASTIIFYDDTSTDGTFELASDACDVRDIRLHRVPPLISSRTHRQEQCYFQIFTEYGEEFEWIGFLDADEYLALPDGQDLLSFLNRSEDVGAVAINWCNYGSSGYVLKPKMPPFYAYNKHYDRNQAINRHVKTFVRPKHWVKKWYNPHFFDVHPLRYEDPIGRLVSWSSTLGITQDEARWEGAKLMHYQCRSMEHFIERIRKRPDLPAHPSTWATYDHNDIEDNSPKYEYENVAVIMHSVVRASIARVMNIYNELPEPGTAEFATTSSFGHVSYPSMLECKPPVPFDDKTGTQVSVKTRKLITQFGSGLAKSSGSMRVNNGSRIPEPHKEDSIFAMLVSNLPGTLFLFGAVDRGEPLLIEEDSRIYDLLAYEIVPLGEADQIALRHPMTRLFLSCELSETSEGLTASRRNVSDWEQFTLEGVGADEKDLDTDPRVELVQAFASGSRNLRQFLCEHRKTKFGVLCTIFPVLVSLASKEEREIVRALCGAASRYIF